MYATLTGALASYGLVFGSNYTPRETEYERRHRPLPSSSSDVSAEDNRPVYASIRFEGDDAVGIRIIPSAMMVLITVVRTLWSL